MGDLTVYTHPGEPGAPGVGDVVVVVRLLGGEKQGAVCVLACVDTPQVDNYPWKLQGSDWHAWAHSIRRPTESEMVTWVLQGGGHG